jgi:hypothetical protein
MRLRKVSNWMMAVGALAYVSTYFIPNEPLALFNAIAIAGWGLAVLGGLLTAYLYFKESRLNA